MASPGLESQSESLLESQKAELNFSVNGITKLDGTCVSDKKRVDGLLWRMMVVRKEQNSSHGGSSKPLGVYLQRIPEATNPLSDTAAVTQATITLVNQDNPERSISKEFKHSYSDSSTDWGYSSFIKLRDLTNPAKGFIVNDSIFLKAKIEVQKQFQSCVSQEVYSQSSVLACPSCQCYYESEGGRKPMSLRCGHTFCSDCLEDKSNSIPESFVSITCIACEQEHSGNSLRDLFFPNHTVIQMIGNFIPKSKYFCEVHKQNMNYYCFVDSCLVCIGCAYQGKHSQHNCKPVNDAKFEAEKQLCLSATKVVRKSSEVSRKLDLLREEQKSLKNQEDGFVQVIDQCYKQLEEIVAKQKESQVQELKEHIEELHSAVVANIRLTEERYSQIQSALTEFKAWQALSPKDALHELDVLKNTLETTESMVIDTESVANPCSSISFIRPMSEVFSYLENHGNPLEITGPRSALQDNCAGSNGDGIDNSVPPSKRKKLSQ